jgi:hypothetical protein
MNSRALFALAFTFAAAVMTAGACSPAADESQPDRSPRTLQDAATTDTYVDPTCVGPEACFKCEPQALSEFLNACTDGTCTKFDNIGRLPLFKPGEPLPPVP